MFSGLFFQGFSASEVEQLNRDWAQVEQWANLPEIPPTQCPELAQLKADIQGIELQDNLLSTTDDLLLSRAELPLPVTNLLLQLEEFLAAGEFGGLAQGEPVFQVVQLGVLELKLDDLTAQRMQQVLAWSRQMHGQGPMIELMVGASIAKQALKRCRADPSLIPDNTSLPAPQVEEFFYALCRDYVIMDRLQIAGSTEGVMFPEKTGVEFFNRAMRRAMANNAQRFYPLRGQVEQLGFEEDQAIPSKLELWAASTLGLPGPITRYVQNFLALHQARQHWIELVKEWDDVLGK
ncbi:MAG: hypothetical protein ACI9F9_001179 [Candidatus Paceibacteria bacterium]